MILIQCEQCSNTSANPLKFNTTIEGQKRTVLITVLDENGHQIDLCHKHIQQKLVYWMATTTPTDNLDEGEPITDTERHALDDL